MVSETPEFEGDGESVTDLLDSGHADPDSLVDLEDWAIDWSPERLDSYLRMLSLICPGLPNLWVVCGRFNFCMCLVCLHLCMC